VSEIRYLVRPWADRDLDDLAYYYAAEETPALGHRFLLAALDAFALLATQPNIGWHSRLKHTGLKLLRVFRVTSFERVLIFYLPRFYLPRSDGIEVLHVVYSSRNLQTLLRRQGLE
jgi:plasmid stabilization system protein ParE